ncbi:MAG: PQQ-binding-like beta-propeller repeat protein [Nibricoccus sp.]
MNENLVYVGAGGAVSAIDKSTGGTVWKFKFPSKGLGADGFVNLLVEADVLYAHTRGELHCIKAATGELLWTNPLSGMGYGIGSIAVHEKSTAVVLKAQQNATGAVQISSTTPIS